MAEKFILAQSLKIDELPEFLKKKHERNERVKQESTSVKEERKQRLIGYKEKLLENSKKFEDEHAENLTKTKSIQNEAFKRGGFYRAPEPKVIFAIRLKGINKIAPKPRKILQLFRLRQINNGVFIKANKATLEMLKKVTPFVAFGYPTLKTIKQLIYKRGYGKIGKPGAYSRVRLMHNSLVSDYFNEYNINGLDDIVHEIYTCGPNFKKVNNFLWPFKLSAPLGGWTAKRRGFCDPRGGDWGNREHLINDLIYRMN